MTANLLTYRCPHCGTPMDIDATVGDELLVCPAKGCGKPFRAEVPSAQPVSQLGVPSAPASSKPLPVAGREADQESPRATVHLAIFRRYPLRCLGYLALLAGGIYAMIVGMSPAYRLWLLAGAMAAGFAALRLIAWWLRVRHTLFTVTSKRCLLQTGVLAKETGEVQLDDVQGVEVSQSVLMRVLGVGDLLIVSDDGERKQVVVRGVEDPKRIADLIRNR